MPSTHFAAIAANPGATVRALEPCLESTERLLQTKALIGPSKLVIADAAVCDNSGEAQLVRPDRDGVSGVMILVDDISGTSDSDLVAATTLDGGCLRHGALIERCRS